jgi:hypothetical protein
MKEAWATNVMSSHSCHFIIHSVVP